MQLLPYSASKIERLKSATPTVERLKRATPTVQRLESATPTVERLESATPTAQRPKSGTHTVERFESATPTASKMQLLESATSTVPYFHVYAFRRDCGDGCPSVYNLTRLQNIQLRRYVLPCTVCQRSSIHSRSFTYCITSSFADRLARLCPGRARTAPQNPLTCTPEYPYNTQSRLYRFKPSALVHQNGNEHRLFRSPCPRWGGSRAPTRHRRRVTLWRCPI